MTPICLPEVAPSRVRGLKHEQMGITPEGSRRTLTGAWIETERGVELMEEWESHPHGCVD